MNRAYESATYGKPFDQHAARSTGDDLVTAGFALALVFSLVVLLSVIRLWRER